MQLVMTHLQFVLHFGSKVAFAGETDFSLEKASLAPKKACFTYEKITFAPSMNGALDN